MGVHLRFVCLLSWAYGLAPLPSRQSPRVRVVLRSAAADVTGTKFEEEDEKKNPQRRPGHQVKGMAPVDEETAKRQEAMRAHQEACPRLSWAEEIRTMAAQKGGFACLSTFQSGGGAISGFPSGSMVGFAVQDDGLPIFCFAGMSGHTKNLVKDSRAALTVTEKSFEGAADARAVFSGRVTMIKDKAEDEAARAAYLASHPGAFWANFGDFKMYRMDEILDVSFVGGFARAGGVTPDEYVAASVDPCLAFAEPVMAHMNDDHGASLQQYVEVLVGTGPTKSAVMKRLDRFGFDVRIEDAASGSKGVLRVPFDEEVTERGAIKTAIVQLSQKCAKLDPDWQPWDPAAKSP